MVIQLKAVVTNNKNIDTPNATSLWKVEGNKKLQKNNQ